MKKIISFFIIIGIGLLFTACSLNIDTNVIVASTYPAYDLTKRIVGDKYEVTQFVPNGQEPHDYEPTAKKIGALYDAKLYIEIGFGFEAYTNSLPDEIKNKAAVTAAKVIQLSDMKNSDNDIKISSLPFTEDEGKLITGFIMHQKLSDLIFTLEKTPKNKKTEIYNTINNMNYRDYTEKYLLGDKYKTLEDLQKASSLLSLEEFLKNSTNYKIYHTLDDYLVNQKQLKQLKIYTGKKTVLLSNGAHLGFLYKPEFIEDLKREITIKPKTASNMN